MGPGLYVHVPFCKRRCGYCDFYVVAGKGDALRTRTVAAILREAEIRGARWPHGSFDNVFIGGGTPSALGPYALRRLLDGLRGTLAIRADAEWTIEANPESASRELLDAALEGGVNRLSLGIQSLDDGELRLLGRMHDARGAEAAVPRARKAGFRNIGCDLIYGLPSAGGRSPWEGTLRRALDLAPDHVSCYMLSLEPHVPMARGGCRLPSEGRVRAEYDLARRLLGEAGYRHYEISNWALPGRECRHNVNVWRRGVYLGLGPGAHGHHGGVRRANRPDLDGYLAAVEAGREPPCEEQPVGERERREERLFLGLRLREGLAWRDLEDELGPEAASRLRDRAARWTPASLLEDDGVRLRLGDSGLFVSSALTTELLEVL